MNFVIWELKKPTPNDLLSQLQVTHKATSSFLLVSKVGLYLSN